ncbi:Uu.00g013750.m01.CDS01 [Anthostomella pinea]|uniref:Uu.00g013750.m01.CDS01 n=1 Tax=Anthostomella pinea TaxID=933095 RepID=A0AAI8VSF3_9PEZI|nr:Uu.00g013750.m01.CDS01 [Anthostomella pinea]
MPTLNDDILLLIFEAVGTSKDRRRDQSCVKTLLACCLVSEAWQRLVQPILNQVLIIDSEDHLQRRLLNRSPEDLKGVREIVLQQSHPDAHFHLDLGQVLRALPLQNLRSFICFDRATFGGYHSHDPLDRSLIGQVRYSPPPLDHDLSSVREALLCNINGGSSWTPFLLRTTKLRDLTFHGAGWTGHSEYANSPLYLPSEPAPFSLKRLEIFRSCIQKEPLRWLLSSSADSLKHLSVRYMQREWDTFADISKLRADGLLPEVHHLTFAVSDSRGVKNFDDIVRKPLAAWQGLHTMYIYGEDNKCRAAIFHGLSQLQPCPVIEMGVGDMRMIDLKSLFRLRKGKLQPGTHLRLISKRVRTEGRMGGYETWGTQDGQSHEYWSEMEEEAKELAKKHGVKLEVAEVSYYA